MSESVYRIVLKGVSDTGDFDTVISKLQELSATAKNVTVQVGDIAEKPSLSLNNLATSFLRVGFMFNMFESAMMRQQMATYMLTNAQNDYNKAVQNFGPTSEQAIQAHDRLTTMTNYTNAANLRANISTALLTTQIILQTGILEKATIAKLLDATATAASTLQDWLETAAIQAKNVALIIMNVLEGPAGWAVLAGAGAMAAGYIATLVTNQPKQNNITVNVTQESDIHSAMQDAERQTIYELRRGG